MKAKWFRLFSVLTIIAIIAGTAFYVHEKNEPHLKFAKGDPDANIEMTVGNGNEKGPTSEAEAEFLERAYPADEIPLDATLNAQAAFNQIKAKGVGRGRTTPGQWSLIGPSTANYPGVLTFSGADYTTSGRITALAIAPNCSNRKCRLYVGAAGGGIWRTDNALSGSGAGWTFVSGNFATNAIGSLLVDTRDASGNTVYAGTGEPNASGDSEAGMGIYKTTDGGSSWTLVPGSNVFADRAVSSMALDGSGNLLVGLASAIRGVSSVTGGAVGCPTPGGCAVRGVYRQTGNTFTLLRATNIRGTTKVAVDPNNSNILYQSSFAEGVWRSLDNGATWTQIKTPLNGGRSDDRAEFAVNKLPDGKTRMYVAIGNAGAPAARFWRTDDAAGAAVFTDMTTAQNINFCTGQCWYDLYVVSPAGNPDVVYLGGSYDYATYGFSTNSRGVLMSMDGGVTFNDVSWDSQSPHNGIHPDQHALVVSDSNPFLFFEGSDGGLMRSSGDFVDQSAECTARGLSGNNLSLCQSLLKNVPTYLYSLNKGLSTLQFQSLSANPADPKNLMGGTQDNGTFETTGGAVVWPQIIYGDGGQSGFNAANSALRFNSFFGQNHDANFQNGDPTKWVIISGKIAGSPEGSNFYAPIIADPNPAVAGTIFEGSQSVWRTQDWGGDQAFLEANCPEFTTPGTDPDCGDFVRIGPDGNTDLTGTGYGTDRAGGVLAAVERTASDTGTLWAATNTGRVYISKNADAAAADVVFTRLDTLASNDPNRFVSSIYIDPANGNHAWVSYSGYNINTPSLPGHVFEVTYDATAGTATWTDRSYDLQDLPITDLVRDDLTGDLYAASDFGVARLPNGGSSWLLAGTGLPKVEVAGLTIIPGARTLYAATHGRSAWMLRLP